MNKNLLVQFIESNNAKNQMYYDFLKEQIDQRFYYYGAHFVNPFDKKVAFAFKSIIKTTGKDFFIKIMSFRKRKNKPTILSTAYFNVDKHFINNYDINVSRPPWKYNQSNTNLFDYQLFKKSEKLNHSLRKENLSYLISDEFINEIKIYSDQVKSHILSNNIVALFVSNDIGFFEKLYISIFKELNLPSFVFVHGLQFWLNEWDFARADYLVVWGKLSKTDFVNMGFDSKRVLISGHPNYKKLRIVELRFDLNDILVLGNSVNGTNPSYEYTLTDRSNCIYYLFLVQDCLKELGVTKARFRPHPSENIEWYKNNIDLTFFEIDYYDLNTSLNAAKLVIGPTSTVFFDALVRGVNYVVFTPPNQFGFGLNGYRTPSMYNGNNEKVPVAKSHAELREILLSKKLIDVTILNDICDEKFDLEDVYSKIKNSMKGTI
jgi:hypothetical protein